MDKKQTPKSDVPPKNNNQRDVNDVPEKPNTPAEPRRYDEADPSWRNPDVQMNPNVNTKVY
jgi:hypothetical protein